MPVWCTTPPGNAKVKVKRSISFLCLPSISLSLSHTHNHTRALLRLLQLLGLNGLGAWGLGLGLDWSAGDKGEGPLGLRVSQLVMEVVEGGGFLGSALGWALAADERQAQASGMAQSQTWPLSEFDREGPVEYWTLGTVPPPSMGVQGGLVCSCRSTPIGTTLVSALPVLSQLYY